MDAFVAPVIRTRIFDVVTRLKWKGLSTHIGFDTPGIPQVDIDHFATGCMAAEHLLQLGTDHFAYVGLSYLKALTLRRDGYVDTLKSKGKKIHHYEVSVTLDAPSKGSSSFASWLKKLPKPIALYCSDDDLAGDVITQAAFLGFSVPDDIAVLGTQDDPALCREVIPGMSSVHLPYHNVGYEAMRRVDEWLSTGKAPAPRFCDSALPTSPCAPAPTCWPFPIRKSSKRSAACGRNAVKTPTCMRWPAKSVCRCGSCSFASKNCWDTAPVRNSAAPGWTA